MNVVMPKMGESVNEGTIIKWHKKVGDKVKLDEIIFEISTDKVDTEIPSPADGILSEIKIKEGETVDVGTVVAVIGGEGSKVVEAPKKQEPMKERSVTLPAVTGSVMENSTASMIDITMPKMGESVMEGTILKWYKKVGDPIKKDETLFEISTDKVDTEVPSPESGIIAEILVAEQETVDVGTVVARLSTSGKMPAAKPAAPVKTTPAVEPKKEEPEFKHTASMHDNFANVIEESKEEFVKGDSSKFYSPLVLNIAQKEKISFDELEKITGTGLNTRITKKDILAYIDNRSKAPVSQSLQHSTVKTSVTPPAPKIDAVYSDGDVIKIPMDNIRQRIMQHMVASRDTSVHVTAMIEVDLTRIHNFIQAQKEEYIRTENVKLTYMPFIANAAVKALKEYPLMNSTIDGSTILQKKFINLGIAVAMEPNGLIVPNIKGAEQRNLIGLAKSINDIALRARNKKLTPDDISNGTFTITNYGVFGTIWGTPIINQPEVAILGVGTAVKKPVVIENDGSDSIAIRHTMAITLAHDHRLIDGMLGGKFLKFLKDTLENFDSSTI